MARHARRKVRGPRLGGPLHHHSHSFPFIFNSVIHTFLARTHASLDTRTALRWASNSFPFAGCFFGKLDLDFDFPSLFPLWAHVDSGDFLFPFPSNFSRFKGLECMDESTSFYSPCVKEHGPRVRDER